MSQAQTSPPPAASPSKAASPQAAVRADLAATAQYLSFDPGLYAVDFGATQTAATDIGLRLPCMRLEALPPTARQKGRAFVSSMAEGGWVWRADEPTFVLVVGAPAGLVLTVYKASDGMPSPQIRIRNIGSAAAPAGGGGPQQVAAPAAQPPAVPARAALPPAPAAVPLSHLLHIRGIGDVKSTGTDWTGKPGSRAPVEGFAIMPIGVIGKESLEYQAVLGNNWNTPWFAGGEFCGSRGLALELLGLRVRLVGDAAARFDCTVWGSFVGRGEIGPVTDGDACEADGAALEAIRVVISPKATPTPTPPPPPAEKPARKPRKKA